ncbi:MAG: ABC transporter ATP-binding protein [Acidobacteria bacterium]|nr:ABC transporter ATP-binding protein [Acidobacteriota bacterium]
MSAVVKTHKLSKWYGRVLGVNDISLEITPGIKGLLGPNGAGKSTFLKIAAGQLKPNIGRMYLFGHDIRRRRKVFGRVGYCPEYDGFYLEMTGRQFLAAMLRLQGHPRATASEMALRALDKIGLTDRQDDIIKTYSLGMRQRLKIAQAFAHEPDLLLLDEPLNGVDPVWRYRVMEMIRDFGRQGKTVIVSSHILAEIESLTDDIILIHQGQVFAQGDIHYIRDLIDTHPHQVFIRTARERELAAVLAGEPSVSGIGFEDGGMMVRTTNRDSFFQHLMDCIVEQKFDVEEITSPDDNLQAVFDYLIGR